MADHVVVMRDCKIESQGPWQDLEGTYSGDLLVQSSKEPQETHQRPVWTAMRDQPYFEQIRNTKIAELNAKRTSGDLATYRYYVSSVGIANFLIMMSCTTSYAVFLTAPQYWVKWWSENRGHDYFYAAGYLLLSTLAWTSTSATLWYDAHAKMIYGSSDG
jgi:ATP-binding cassette subfamily C (CFTR/MRP) protein 1